MFLSIGNTQTLLSLPLKADLELNEKAVTEVFLKVLDNYIKWCKYLHILPVCNNLEAENKDRKLFFGFSVLLCLRGRLQMSAFFQNAYVMYFTIWAECNVGPWRGAASY